MAIDKDAARKRVIDLTRRALDEGGLDAFNVRRVAKEAGISVGTIYNLFGDVDDLLRIVNSQLLDALGAEGEKAVLALDMEAGLGLADKLLRLSGTYHRFVDDNANAWTAMLAFNRKTPTGDVPDWYLQRQEALFGIIADILRDSSLRDDDTRRKIAARALWSSVHGIVTNGYRGADDDTEKRATWAQIDILVTTFVRGLERV